MQTTTLHVDPHVHSEGSYDGHEPVELILEHAAEIGLDAVVVTDHDVVDESLRAADLAPEYGLIGIPGVEVSTAHGHLLAVGVEELPPRREPFDETVAWIRERGGVAIVPHPFQRSRHGVRRRYIADCDAVETFNAWLFTGYRNNRARSFAAANGYPDVAASDAHTLEYVGRAFTEIEVPGARAEITAEDVLDAVRDGTTAVRGRRAPVPMAAKHYAVAAWRKSRYYAKAGALRSAYLAKRGAVGSAAAARFGATRSARSVGRALSVLR